MAEDSRTLLLRCVECHGSSFNVYGKDHWRCTACLGERAEFVLIGKSTYPCSTEHCPGDGRYAPPGRGHQAGCMHMRSEPFKSVGFMPDTGVTRRNPGCYCEEGFQCDYCL